jgi:hypothetical protein
MDLKQYRTDMGLLIALCEEMGLSPWKNGLKEPDDIDAARKAVTRLYIVAENLHDVGRKAKDSTLLLSATKLKKLSEKLLKDMLVEGLSDLFALPEPPSLILKQ